jgi:hypothetical protein
MLDKENAPSLPTNGNAGAPAVKLFAVLHAETDEEKR